MSAPAFTERDVAKAISGAKAAGFEPARVDIDRKTGRISLFVDGATPVEEERDEIGEWLAEHSGEGASSR